MATASNKDAAARVWDVAGCREIRQLPGDQDGVSAVAFSPDGRLLVTGEGRNRTVRLWDAATGRELRQFDQGRPLDFSPDGGLLAIAVDDAIELRDVSTGESIGRLRPQFKLRGSVVATFTPDGRHLLIGGSGDGH